MVRLYAVALGFIAVLSVLSIFAAGSTHAAPPPAAPVCFTLAIGFLAVIEVSHPGPSGPAGQGRKGAAARDPGSPSAR
jgi:hypothetical protein